MVRCLKYYSRYSVRKNEYMLNEFPVNELCVFSIYKYLEKPSKLPENGPRWWSTDTDERRLAKTQYLFQYTLPWERHLWNDSKNRETQRRDRVYGNDFQEKRYQNMPSDWTWVWKMKVVPRGWTVLQEKAMKFSGKIGITWRRTANDACIARWFQRMMRV